MNGLEIVGSIVVVTAEVLLGGAALIALWHLGAAATAWYVRKGYKVLFGVSEGRLSWIIDRGKERADKAWAKAKREGASEHDCLVEAMNAYITTFGRYRFYFLYIERWGRGTGNRLPKDVEVEDDGLYFRDYGRKPRNEDCGPINHDTKLEAWSKEQLEEVFTENEVEDIYAFWAKHKPRIIPKAWELKKVEV